MMTITDIMLYGCKVINTRTNESGEATGGIRPCQLLGCTGIRICVRFPCLNTDKRAYRGKPYFFRYPCLKGMEEHDGVLYIL